MTYFKMLYNFATIKYIRSMNDEHEICPQQHPCRFSTDCVLAHFKAKVGKNSKKLKIVRCNHLTILNNILKVPMYPLGAFSIMTRFFRFPYYSHIVKKREISSSLITKMTRITRKLIKTTYKTFKQSPKFFKRFSSY